MKFKITVIKDNKKAIAKKISWDGKKLVKTAQASISDGFAESKDFTLVEFKDFLTKIQQDECITLGKLKHGSSGTIVGDKKNQNLTEECYARSLQNFEWHDEYQVCFIDFDDSEIGNLSPSKLRDILAKAIPEFADLKMVGKFSSSANIIDVSSCNLSRSNGFHLYFLVKNPAMISAVFSGRKSILHKRLWTLGYGYIKNSRPKNPATTAVTKMERTVYDNTVFSPERIIFEADPILENGLDKLQKGGFLLDGSRDFLDLALVENITEKEEQLYKNAVKVAKEKNDFDPYVIKCRKAFKENVRQKVDNGEYNDRPEYQSKSKEDIVELEYELNQKRILALDFEIELDSGQLIRVEEILKDPVTYHNSCCKDPHEPDYGTSRIAIIYSDQKKPKIFSHAHGGIIYQLMSPVDDSMRNFNSRQYWLDNFYLAAHNRKNDIYHIIGNKIEKYSQNGFKNRFAGYSTIVKNKDIPMTKWWMSNPEKKCIADDAFAPGQKIIYKKFGENVLNEYVPEILRYGIPKPSKADCEASASVWLNHVRHMIHDPSEAEILIDWYAFLVQVPHERPMFSPLVLSRTRGVGKDVMNDIITRMFGHKFAKKANLERLSKDFWGDTFFQSKLVTVSECGSSKDRFTVGNTTKEAITTTTMGLNLKGREMVFCNVYAGIIFFSNSQNPFRLDEDDRRFFVTRCDWTKKYTDKLKQQNYFKDLISFYSKEEHLNGLYYYLLNRRITTDIKGDAPSTTTKTLMMNAEPNEAEQFFIDLNAHHPCRYWGVKMLKELFVNSMSDNDDAPMNIKQFNVLMREYLPGVCRISYQGKTVRVRTFSHAEAEMDNDVIRNNMDQNWGKTTNVVMSKTDLQDMDNEVKVSK